MTFPTSHSIGDAGHTTDHNSIISTLAVSINTDGTMKPAALYDVVTTVASSTASYTFANPSGAYNVTLTAATVTFTMPTNLAGASFFVAINQDGTGNRVPVFTGVKWPGGGAPVWSTAASSKDRVTFYCIDGSNWEGYPAGLAMA